MLARGLDNTVQTSIIVETTCDLNAAGTSMKRKRTSILSTRVAVVAMSFFIVHCSTPSSNTGSRAYAIGFTSKKKKNDSDKIRLPIFEKPSNPRSPELSPDAVQLANTLNLLPRLTKLKTLQVEARQQAASGRVSVELRQDIADLRIEILEAIEQTRLEIDFASAEIEEEQASVEEVLTWYENERNERVNRANLWAFRTNGILWAAAEAFTIPSYKHPRFSIPSGTVGIVAGLVPSMFSEFALRSAGGKHHERKAYPNMLCKLYDLPVTPRTDYPDSVWKHLNQPPTNSSITRREMLLAHWEDNQNIHTLKSGVTSEKIKQIAGIDQSDINIDLLNDRASMLRDLKATVLQMTRPLMELSMCLRDQKQIAKSASVQ